MVERRGGPGVLVALAMAGSCATAPLAAAQPPAAAAPAAAAAAAVRAPVDPAALVVQHFYEALFESMRHAGEWHMRGRYDHLYPVMLRLFDVPTMTRLAVGLDFAKLTPDQQAALRDAFGKLMVATFASVFDDFKGETYRVDGDVTAKGADRLVKSRFNGENVSDDLNFLLRGKGADWRVVDIYLDGHISQLAIWRTEYSSLLEEGGFDGLMAALKAQTDKDMKAF